MKRSYFIFVLIFFIVIGYATLTTELNIMSDTKVGFNKNDYNIELTNLKLNGEDKKNLINQDKLSFSIQGNINDIVSYQVINDSSQYDSKIKLICTPSDSISINQVNQLNAKMEKGKEIAFKKNTTIDCTIFVEKIERISIMEKENCNLTIGTTYNFNYKNFAQKFSPECDGIYKVELWGAQGGDYFSYGTGGLGSYTTGELFMRKDDIYYLFTGEHINTYHVPSFNGGNTSGGGATDIRCFYNRKNDSCEETSSLDWNNYVGLNSRIMVAAGGAYVYNTISGSIGHGGELIGNNGSNTTGATQTKGGINTSSGGYDLNGIPFATTGKFGTGGDGYGGGNGYYGGAGGHNSLGSGGSSFISGYKGCVAILNENLTNEPRTVRLDSNNNNCTDSSATDDILCSFHYSEKIFLKSNMKAGNQAMPTHDGMSTMTGNTGNGYAKITYLGK